MKRQACGSPHQNPYAIAPPKYANSQLLGGLENINPESNYSLICYNSYITSQQYDYINKNVTDIKDRVSELESNKDICTEKLANLLEKQIKELLKHIKEVEKKVDKINKQTVPPNNFVNHDNEESKKFLESLELNKNCVFLAKDDTNKKTIKLIAFKRETETFPLYREYCVDERGILYDNDRHVYVIENGKKVCLPQIAEWMSTKKFDCW